MITIFDINNSLVEEAKRLEKYGIGARLIDVNDLLKVKKIDAVVSPANSFGYMDGGIDGVYSRVFPGIEEKVRRKIAEEYPTHKNGEKGMLPIGQSVIVETGHPNCPFLIVAPTMEVPSIIDDKEQLAAAFSAVTSVQIRNPEWEIYCPGLGTGVGMVSSKECVDYMIKSLDG